MKKKLTCLSSRLIVELAEEIKCALIRISFTVNWELENLNKN